MISLSVLWNLIEGTSVSYKLFVLGAPASAGDSAKRAVVGGLLKFFARH